MVLFNNKGNFLVGPQIPLGTRKGRKIENEQRMEQNPVRLQAAKEMILNAHPKALCRSLSGIYNCMGMVFANRRTWVDPSELSLILEDDEYRKLPSMSEAQMGDIVIYRDSTGEPKHVGMIVEKNTDLLKATQVLNVLSQWGALGEYIHPVDDVNPALGVPVEFWTDRK